MYHETVKIEGFLADNGIPRTGKKFAVVLFVVAALLVSAAVVL